MSKLITRLSPRPLIEANLIALVAEAKRLPMNRRWQQIHAEIDSLLDYWQRTTHSE